ncbi:MAG TPA: alkaline phosphatase family protein, partial [Humisphaera sp.]
GMRPDLIFRSGSVHMAELLDEGTFTLWARTSDLPYTLPSHVSMMTGVRPTRHGIEENEYRLDRYPQFPTIFEAAHEKGLTTAFVAGKSKLKVLCKPGSIDHDFVEDQDDEKVAERAVRVLRDQKPNLLVVHFRGCDYAGHFHEWGSPQQLAALRDIDAGVGQILRAVEAGGMAGETAVLLTADHGGAGITHWEDHRGSTIPWVIRGPGIRRQFDLDRLGSRTPVKTEDTFATVVALLGLPMPQDVDGKPVMEIVDVPSTEMLRDRP